MSGPRRRHDAVFVALTGQRYTRCLDAWQPQRALRDVSDARGEWTRRLVARRNFA